MKALFFVVLLVLIPPQAPPNTADIEGRVLRTGNQEPIPNAQITLIKSSAGETALPPGAVAALDSLPELVSMAFFGTISPAELNSSIEARERSLLVPPGTLARAIQTAITDDAGHFIFKNQAPGKYKVLAGLDGYFGPPSNGPAAISVTVEAQKPIPPTDVFMVKGGIITGRVRDPNGQPAVGVTVAAERVIYSYGRPLWTVAVSKATDDQGVFRIFWLTPGEYYLDVMPRVVTAVPGPQSSLARTFFPGVTDPAAAIPLIVKDGTEVAGIDLSIRTAGPTSIFKISGKATNPLAVSSPTPGAVGLPMRFTLSPREPGILDPTFPPSVQNSLPAAASQNGEFEIRNVRPGSYDLFITYQAPRVPAASPTPLLSTRFYIDRAQVDVRDSDVEGIDLQIQKGTELRGKVVGQGTTPIALENIKMRLRQLDTMPEGFAVIVGEIGVDSKGEFSAQDIPSARYTLRFSGLPETAYVADIRQGGTTVFDSGFNLGKQTGTLIEVLVNSNGATIEGSVQTGDQKPSANATVVLVPSPSHRQNAQMYKTVQTDDLGRFSMKGVAPGGYTLFAWESVPYTAWMNSDFLAKYENRGRAVVVSEGTRLEVQLDLIPGDINQR